MRLPGLRYFKQFESGSPPGPIARKFPRRFSHIKVRHGDEAFDIEAIISILILRKRASDLAKTEDVFTVNTI